MKGVVNYEGHTFSPWECSGWSYSGSISGGIWHVLIGKRDEVHRDFSTRNCPIKQGGLADQIDKAKKELDEMRKIDGPLSLEEQKTKRDFSTEPIKLTMNQKVKLKDGVTRGSLFSCTDEHYKEFIANIPYFGAKIIKINESSKTAFLVYYHEKYYSGWFYQEQLEPF